MKRMKKVLLIGLIVLPILLIGCGKKPKVSADESAKRLFDFIVKRDISGVKNMEAPKHIISEVLEMQRQATNKIEENAEPPCISNDIRIESFKKIIVHTETVSKTSKGVQVKLKVNYINLSDMDKKAYNYAVEKVKDLEVKGHIDEYNKISDLYYEKLENISKNAKPSSDMREETFEFVKEKNVWLPRDLGEFYLKIFDLVEA